MILDDAIAFLDAGELSARIRAKKLSPVDLTETYLARIERLAPALRCFVTVTRDLALVQAAQAKKEIDAGKWRGPLHGIPYGAKDLLDTAGIRTTWGAKPYEARVPASDATVIVRLREAGAILLGKLAMVELAGGLGYEYPDSSLTGACATPWDRGRWSGGSSSGSGSAVAAGLVGFAIGSETWGSITCPSAFCGVSGLRPTYGAVSRKGAMAISWTLDKVGPMARSAQDCARILSVIGGRDPLDPTTVDLPEGLATAGAAPKKAALVGFPAAPAVDPGVRAAFDAAAGVLRAAGVTLESATLPDYPWEPLTTLFVLAEGRSSFEELLKSGRASALAARAHADWKDDQGGFEKATAVDYVKATRIRREAQEALATFFDLHEVIVAPTLPIVAPAIDRSFKKAFEFPDTVGAAGNLCGLPAVAVPCGFVGGLPVSLQIVGRPGSEAKIVAMAALFQSKTDWHTRRPPET